MKKLLAILFAACCISSASAASYKGYVETFGGLSIPSEGDLGGTWGVATSHGVEIIDGLFVGAGIDFSLGMTEYYTYETYDYSYYDFVDYDVEIKPLFATFAECRYSFLRYSRVSPFVGLRLGGGYNGYSEAGALYFSPAFGCAFNFTDNFGMDLSLGYSLFTGSSDEGYIGYGDYVYGVEYSLPSVSCVNFRIGIHF